MAAFQVSSGPVSLAASATKTFVDLATPAGTDAYITKWWVECDATSAGTATSALRVQIGLFSAAVTTHTAVTPDLFDGGGGGVASQLTAGIATTVEGAGTPTTNRFEEHVLGLTQSQLIVWEPTSRYIPVSSFWRIRIIAPAGIGTSNIYAGVGWTE